MKRLLLLLSLLFFTASPLQAADVTFNGIKPQAIIDVRTPAEFAEEHLEGALNIPLDHIATDIRQVKGVHRTAPSSSIAAVAAARQQQHRH